MECDQLIVNRNGTGVIGCFWGEVVTVVLNKRRLDLNFGKPGQWETAAEPIRVAIPEVRQEPRYVPIEEMEIA